MSAIVNGKGTVGIRGGAVVGPPIITQFITTWKTDNAGTSTSTQISIPTLGTGYTCTVDWGDGTSNSYSGTAPTMLHTYSVAGTYTVTISGTFPRIYFGNAGDKLKLLSIQYWGTGVWSGSMGGAFSGCANLKINASDVPNFASVTSANSMFTSCSSLTSLNVSGWNFGSCTDMTQMFYNTSSLSAITGINTWNTSKVTSVSTMFMNSVVRTIDLSGLNFSACTTFGNMFRRATLIRNINVSNIILNTSANIDMSLMFMHDAGGSSLTGVTGMNTWNTSKVTNTTQMFANCSVLPSLDLSGWIMTANTNTTSMFQSCSVLASITGTGSWDTRNVTSMSNMFASCAQLRSLDVSGWQMSACTNPSSIFSSCGSLTGLTGYENWDTRNVTNMTSMFSNTPLSSINIRNWNFSKVTSLGSMFYNSKIRTIDLSSLNFSACTTFANMFGRATLLRDINVSNMILNTTGNTTLSGMFMHDSGGSSLTGITGMNTWNTSKVNNTSQMFSNCTVLPSLDLSNWNLSDCTNTSSMFQACSVLTGLTVSNWNLSTSTGTSINMSSMFNGMGTVTPKIITGLNTWNITRVTNFSSFLAGTTLDTTTYSNMLIAWDALDPVNSLSFNGGGSLCNPSGLIARQSLVTNDLWSIIDGNGTLTP